MANKATRQAYGEELAELFKQDPNVFALTADLAGSVKTDLAAKVDPSRHIDCGIAEANMVDIAVGLAASGKIPFASSFAIFEAGRAYEQIRNSVCYPNMNVKLCATHAGISVGEDGASHQSIADLSLMRGLPNMTVLQPCDAQETKEIIRWAYHHYGPVYVRLSRYSAQEIHDETYRYDPDHAEVLAEGKDTVLLATGLEVQESLKARELLAEQGIDAGVINVASIKPLDKETVLKAAGTHPLIFTVEEHSIIGGLGSAAAEVLAEAGQGRLVRIGMNDTFGESGTASALLEKYQLDAKGIAARVSKELGK